MRLRRISLATKYTVMICLVLLGVNAILGRLIMTQSGKTMRNLINRHMLSVADTASSMVNADELKNLTAEDVGSENYRHIADTLTTIKRAQKDVDIKYIYLVKREGDHYVYTVDPDPEDPAEYGEEVVDTPGQDLAWFGTSAVDPEPVEDEWGCYYTAWSSVKNSFGESIGMVGIDFDASWFDQQMERNRLTVIIVCGLSILVSLAIMSLMTYQLYTRFKQMDNELSILSGNIEQLVQVVRDSSDSDTPVHVLPEPDPDADVILVLSEKIHATRELLTDYMDYVKKQAYTDSMTGLSNKDAYLNLVHELNEKIKEGTASFSVTVFDVNGLKRTNDNYGHEYGDQLIIDSAKLIGSVFGTDHVFRIGGDEFIGVIEKDDEIGLGRRFLKLFDAVDHFNKEERAYETELSFSLGGAVYKPGEDASFLEVFKRADMAMYQNKNEYYQKKGTNQHA